MHLKILSMNEFNKVLHRTKPIKEASDFRLNPTIAELQYSECNSIFGQIVPSLFDLRALIVEPLGLKETTKFDRLGIF